MSTTHLPDEQELLAILRGGPARAKDWLARRPRGKGAPEFVGVDFQNLELQDFDFSGAILRSCRMDGCRLAGASFQGADLRGTSFAGATGLEAKRLAGARLAGATLPGDILDGALASASRAEAASWTTFLVHLAGCSYTALTVWTTSDLSVLKNEGTAVLPVLGTAVPINGFLLFAPIVLWILFVYLRWTLLRTWTAFGSLPAELPDGSKAEEIGASFLIGVAAPSGGTGIRHRSSVTRLTRFLARLAFSLPVPLTLLLLWGRSLPRHDQATSLIQAVLLGCSVVLVLQTAMIRLEPGEPAPPIHGPSKRRLASARSLLAGSFVGIVFLLLTMGGIHGVPNREDQELDPCKLRFSPAPDRLAGRWTCDSDKSGETDAPRGFLGCNIWAPRALRMIGLRTWLDLRTVAVAEKPPGWDGTAAGSKMVAEEGLLGGQYMAFADMRGAFLPGADVRASNLRGADLSFADAQRAVFGRKDSGREPADLTCARMRNGRLQGAFLESALLDGARLDAAHLTCARMKSAKVRDADLIGVDLRWADLSDATLLCSRLDGANLSGARLKRARLRGVTLKNVRLDEADLSDTDLSETLGLTTKQLQRACVDARTQLPAGVQRPLPGMDCTDRWRKLIDEQCGPWR